MKKLFAKVDPSVDKILSFRLINLSISQNLVLDVLDSGVLLSDFAQQLRHENAEVPDIYFTLFGAAGLSPTLVLKKKANGRERERAGSLSKFKQQKQQRLYTQRDAACGSAPTSVKTSNLPVSKLRQFLNATPSYI